MKLSISSLAWLVEESSEVCDLLLENKIHCIDTVPLHIVKSLLEPQEDFDCTWSKRNISIVGMQSLFYEIRETKFFENEDSVNKATYYFKNVASLSEKIGVKSLVFGSPKQRCLDGSEIQMNRAKSFFKRASEICKEHKTILCIEPNSSEYGTNFLTSTDETAEFIRSLNLENVMMNFDTGCDLMNGVNPVESFKKHRDIIGHIHLSSPRLKSITDETLDHSLLSSTIKKSGYDGFITVEMLGESSKENRIKNLCESLDLLNRHYGEK